MTDEKGPRFRRGPGQRDRSRERADSRTTSALIAFKGRVLHHGGRLSAHARLIGLVLADHVFAGSQTFPSVGTLASLAGLSEREGRRAIAELRNAGLVIVEGRGGRNTPNTYRLILEDTECPGGSRCKCPKPGLSGRVDDDKPGQSGRVTDGETRTGTTGNPDETASETRTKPRPKPGPIGRGNSLTENSLTESSRSEARGSAVDATTRTSSMKTERASAVTNLQGAEPFKQKVRTTAERYLSAFNVVHGTRHRATPTLLRWIETCLTAEPPYSAEEIVAAAIMTFGDEFFADKSPTWPLRFPSDQAPERVSRDQIGDLLAQITPGRRFAQQLVDLVHDLDMAEFFTARTAKTTTRETGKVLEFPSAAGA